MKIKFTPEETQEMLKRFAHPHFTNTMMYVVNVEVDPEWVKEVLPAPLEPDEPVVTFCMEQGDQFSGLISGLQCRYGDIVGTWGLAFTMDTDLATIFGREGMGEPKKIATVVNAVEGDEYVGTMSRFGTELLRIEGKLGEALDYSDMTGMDKFHFKYSIKADGSGITDVDLVHAYFKTEVTSKRALSVDKFELNDFPMDIYGTIPVTKVRDGFCAMYKDMRVDLEYLAEVDRDGFLPWAFFKFDDYRLTMSVD